MHVERGRPAPAARRSGPARIAERADGDPPEVSGGEQQRVAVARALANRASVVLADEPTAALDSRRGRQVMELFRRVAHEQDAGVIVVTHDQRALDVFDTICEMEDGVIRPASAERLSAVTGVPV
jgi:putative ABC transport system ATP-binding protein